MECDGLRTRITSLQIVCSQHENCPNEDDYLSLQAQCEDLVSQRSIHVSHISELEGQLEQYVEVIHRLQESSVELQTQAELAAEEIEELTKDVALKEKHIHSLEGIIERLESHIEPEQVPSNTQVLSGDVQRLAQTLERVRAEYQRLERTVGENEHLSKQELRAKEAELESSKRQMDLEVARLRAQVEILTAENQRLM